MDCIFSTSLEGKMQQTPETQLAYLGFRLIPPSRYLRPYVQSYWYFRREEPLSASHQEYMHPRGGFGIIFNIGDPLGLDAKTVSEPVFLDGANTVSRAIGFHGHVELIGIRFLEGGAYPFLGEPLNEFRNETTLPDSLDRPDLLHLYARLQEAGSLTTRVGLLEEWLASRLLLGKKRSLLIGHQSKAIGTSLPGPGGYITEAICSIIKSRYSTSGPQKNGRTIEPWSCSSGSRTWIL
jgi:hypothetical protein